MGLNINHPVPILTIGLLGFSLLLTYSKYGDQKQIDLTVDFLVGSFDFSWDV